jgi:hypothetical protein
MGPKQRRRRDSDPPDEVNLEGSSREGRAKKATGEDAVSGGAKARARCVPSCATVSQPCKLSLSRVRAARRTPEAPSAGRVAKAEAPEVAAKAKTKVTEGKQPVGEQIKRPPPAPERPQSGQEGDDHPSARSSNASMASSTSGESVGDGFRRERLGAGRAHRPVSPGGGPSDGSHGVSRTLSRVARRLTEARAESQRGTADAPTSESPRPSGARPLPHGSLGAGGVADLIDT